MANLLSWLGNKAKEVAAGVERQVNPFDGGATYSNPRPPQQQQKIQAQRQQAQNLINRATQIQQQVNNAARNPLGFVGGQAYNAIKANPIQVKMPSANDIGGAVARQFIPGLKDIKQVQDTAKKGMATPQGKAIQQSQNQVVKNYINLANQAVKPIDYGKGVNKAGKIVTDTAPIQAFKRLPGVQPVSSFVNENIVQPNIQTLSRTTLAGQGADAYDDGWKGAGQGLQDVGNIASLIYAPAKGASLGVKMLADALPGATASIGQNLAAGERDLKKIGGDAALAAAASSTFGLGLRGAGKLAGGAVKQAKKITTNLVSPEAKLARQATAEAGSIGLPKQGGDVPETTRVFVKSKFRDGGGYADIPVIRKVENKTLYQGGSADGRQFWTENKDYAAQFGKVTKKTGTFYEVDNGNRMTSVYVDAANKPKPKRSWIPDEGGFVRLPKRKGASEGDYWTTPLKDSGPTPVPAKLDSNGVQIKPGDKIEFYGASPDGKKGTTTIRWEGPYKANASGKEFPGQWLGNGTLDNSIPFKIIERDGKPFNATKQMIAETPKPTPNAFEPKVIAYHGSTNNKLTSLEPGAKTGLNEKRNLLYLTEDQSSALDYTKNRGVDGNGLGVLSDSKTGKVYKTEVRGKVVDAYNRDGSLSSLTKSDRFNALSSKTKNQLTNDTGLSADILESNPELVKFLKDENITAVRGHLSNTSGGTELIVVNPAKTQIVNTTPTKPLPIVGEPQVKVETPQAPITAQATPDEIKISTTPQTNVKLNTKRLDIAPEEAAQIQAQTSEVVDRLSNKEVQDLATNAGIDTRSYSPEQTKKKIAEQLNLRNETAMIANKAKEARLAGDTDEAARLIREAAERGGIARSQGTDLARQLQARRIIADELATPEQRLFKLLDNAGVNPEVYSKRLATVDFDNANEVIKAYRDLVPATAGDWIDVVRYNSMLSSPLTQIVNVSSTAGNISLAPVERGITGTLDHLRSAITGGERTVASGEGRAYAGGMVKGVKQGLKDFKDTLQGLDENLNADVGQGGFVPVKAYGDSATHDILSFPGRLLGAFDNFHRAIVSSGSDAALSKRTAAGLKVGNIAAENAEEAAYRTFNGEIGKADQGYILRGIDEMTGLVMKARASKNPVVKWPAKLTLPFVRIGSNLLKQGIEYGPGGLATIPGAANKQAQLAKSIMGTAVFGAAGSLIGRNRLTWAEPTNADQKKAFKEAGMQPYSVKIGNNWVGFAKLPPIISFNFALAAALDDAVKTAKLNENGLDNVMGAVAKYGNFLADQSYVKNVGDLLAAVKGDAESVTRLVGNYPQQFIPERAFTGWLAKMSDSTQRMINTDASFADKQVETLFQQYPFLRQKTTARTDTAGNPLASQHPLLNAFSPTPVSTENAEGKLGYDVLQQRLGANRDKTALKKSGVLTEGQQKSADKKVKETEIKKTLSPAERQLYDYSNADLEAMNSESAKKVLALKGTTSSTASTDPKSKYTAAQKKYDEDKKAGKISDVKDMAEQSKLTRLRAQSAYSQDTVDLYSQSFKNIISFVNSNKNGAKLWEEVKSLDKKMTDAGYTSKLYNKNGSLKSTVAKGKGGKRGGAKKGRVTKLPKFNITGKAVSYKKVGAPKAKLPVSKLPKIKINKMVA